MYRKTIPLLLAGLFLFSLVSAGSVAAQDTDEPEAQAVQTVYDVIRNHPRLETLQLLVDAAGLRDNLEQDGPFTVFAPTDEALAAFDLRQYAASVMPAAVSGDMTEGAAAVIEAQKITATDALLYHVMNGRYSSRALAEQGALPTLQGSRLLFDMDGDTLMLNEMASVVEADIRASNGVVHLVDAIVPLPGQHTLPTSKAGSPANTMAKVLSDDGRFDTFLDLAQQAGLIEMLDNPREKITLFAPTDEAFANAPEELMDRWLSDTDELRTILMYHIVGDRLNINQIATSNYLPTLEGRALSVDTDEDVQVYLNGRPVQDFNLISANGVVHVMDEVVLP